MASLEKLVARLRRSPKGANFADLVRVLSAAGYVEVRVTGSHHIFRRSDGGGLPLTLKRPGSGHVAPGAVRDVLNLLDLED